MGGSGSGQQVMGQLATLVYPWPTSESNRPGKPALEGGRSVCLSLSLSLYIYILYRMQYLGNVDFIHTGL